MRQINCGIIRTLLTEEVPVLGKKNNAYEHYTVLIPILIKQTIVVIRGS